MAEPKEEIEKLLLDTKREGIEDLVAYLDTIGFYTAPASTRFHGAEPEVLDLYFIRQDLNSLRNS